MRRILIIRRRRYLARAMTLGFAVALLVPASALARYEDRAADRAVDPFAASGLSAEDAHGGSALNGTVVLPAAERKAVELAGNSGAAAHFEVVGQRYEAMSARPGSYTGRGDPVVSQPTVTTVSSIPWAQVALFSALGLVGAAGLIVLGLFATRRTTRIAHS